MKQMFNPVCCCGGSGGSEGDPAVCDPDIGFLTGVTKLVHITPETFPVSYEMAQIDPFFFYYGWSGGEVISCDFSSCPANTQGPSTSYVATENEKYGYDDDRLIYWCDTIPDEEITYTNGEPVTTYSLDTSDYEFFALRKCYHNRRRATWRNGVENIVYPFTVTKTKTGSWNQTNSVYSYDEDGLTKYGFKVTFDSRFSVALSPITSYQIDLTNCDGGILPPNCAQAPSRIVGHAYFDPNDNRFYTESGFIVIATSTDGVIYFAASDPEPFFGLLNVIDDSDGEIEDYRSENVYYYNDSDVEISTNGLASFTINCSVGNYIYALCQPVIEDSYGYTTQAIAQQQLDSWLESNGGSNGVKAIYEGIFDSMTFTGPSLCIEWRAYWFYDSLYNLETGGTS